MVIVSWVVTVSWKVTVSWGMAVSGIGQKVIRET